MYIYLCIYIYIYISLPPVKCAPSRFPTFLSPPTTLVITNTYYSYYTLAYFVSLPLTPSVGRSLELSLSDVHLSLLSLSLFRIFLSLLNFLLLTFARSDFSSRSWLSCVFLVVASLRCPGTWFCAMYHLPLFRATPPPPANPPPTFTFTDRPCPFRGATPWLPRLC